MRLLIYPIIVFLLFLPFSRAQQEPLEDWPVFRFHLAGPDQGAEAIPEEVYLEVLEGLCRAATQFQDESGAIIDPFLEREHQYSTPYFAFAVGVLLHSDRAPDLKNAGVLAMEHATQCIAGGSEAIPDQHGEFFIAPLTEALQLYEDQVDTAIFTRWHQRMKTPLTQIMANQSGRLNNWRTYAMKGEWLRARAGLVDINATIAYIENSWIHQTQRDRMAIDRWHLYQDWSSDPQSHAVEAVGRGNILALLHAGYDGPSAAEMWAYVRKASAACLLLQAPTGQCPPNGRTDNHVFNDVLYQLIFEVMSLDARQQGNLYLAGQYRQAAKLAFQSILRWRRDDPAWQGSFYITKNHFDPALRIGYQPASQWGNYSGAVMYHLAEAILVRHAATIPEASAPTLTGGYALRTDPAFSTFVANAGGMQVFVNLRGASVPKYGLAWTPLGVVRFSKAEWDDRLGPSDGAFVFENPERGSGIGVSFGPSWEEDGTMIHISQRHRDYRITPHVAFSHPLLVRFTLTYHYVTGSGGPYFKQSFIVTPEGIMTMLSAPQPVVKALTMPILVNDGRRLSWTVKDNLISTGYTEDTDQQHFIALNQDAHFTVSADSIQSTYGWLRSANMHSSDDTLVAFIYPQRAGERTGLDIKDAIKLRGQNFDTPWASVRDSLYIGKLMAGGKGKGIDLNLDGTNDLTFNRSCNFIVTMKEGVPTAVEADRPVTMHWSGQTYSLQSYQPIDLHHGSNK